MSIFVQSASAAIAKAVKVAGVWVAWGEGNPSWDEVSMPEAVNATALYDELGRRRAQVIEFVSIDPGGDISVPQGNYSISPTPTDTLYIRCAFADTDAVGQFVREAGVFIGTVPVTGLPVGTEYFTPNQIDQPGVLLMLEHFAKITRTSEFSVALEFVMTL